MRAEFDDCEVSVGPDTTTLLRELPDQGALHGLIQRIADLGLEGKKIKIDGRLEDAYYFCVGGAVGAHEAVARPVGYRAAATEVPAAIERLLRVYLAQRRPGENFRQFCAAHTDEEIRHILAAEAVEAVERDVALARPPHGLDG